MAVVYDSSDSDDEFFEEFLGRASKRRKRWVRRNPFEELDDDEFQARFRLRKTTVLLLLSEIEASVEHYTDRNQSVSPINQLLITLRFYATGCIQLVISDLFGIHRTTACRIIHKITHHIACLYKKFVKFPATGAERRKVIQDFYDASNFPMVLGAIDCTHVPIISVGGDEAESYRNRKGYFPINVQLVCDFNLFITDVIASHPGSAHDSTIFDACHLRAEFETNKFGPGFLVGDNGYGNRNYLMTPLTNPQTQAEKNYNRAQISCRNPIERTIGVLKGRFQALKYGLKIKLKNSLPVIVAIVICHNIAMSSREGDPPADEELDHYISLNRQKGVRVDFEEVDVLNAEGSQSNTTRTALINSRFAR